MTRTRLLLGASLVAITAGGAFAQQGDDPRQTFHGVIVLDTVTISGAQNPTAPLEGTVARSSASGKTGRSLFETQSSVSVIPRAQMEEQGAANVAEALSYSAGVMTNNYGSDPRFDSLFLRGFNLENDKFLDGLRLMRSTQFPTSAPAFELYGLERVEIMRGPSSVLYGAGTPAGLVYMVQKRAQADGDFTEAGLGFDSRGSASVFGDANRVVDDRVADRVTAKVGDTQTDVEGIDNQRAYLGLSASYALSDATEVEFMASYHDDAPISPTGVPNTLVGVVDSRDLREFNFADESVNRSDRRMGTLSFGLTHDFGNGWRLNNTFRYTNFDWSYDNIYLRPATGTVVGRGLIDQDETFRALATDLRLAGTVTTGAVTHDLTFGLDAQKHRERARTAFSNISPIDFDAPVYGGVSIDAPWYIANKAVDARQIGLYAVDEIETGNWRATLGLRHEWTHQTGQSATLTRTTDYSRDDTQLTGHVGLGYVWDNGVTAYASYSTSYLPQPGFDIEGDPLRPTHGKQWELGLKYEPTGFDGLFTAALYDLRETDRNTSVTEEIDGGTITGTRQIGEARIRGLELEGVAEFGEGWSLKGAYTYASTRISGDNDGNELANTPRHAASLWLSRKWEAGALRGLQVGGGIRHMGTRWSSNANTLQLEAVTLLDLGASYEWENGLIGRLNVTNLTDEVYISAIGLNSSYFGDGRNVMASLTYKW